MAWIQSHSTLARHRKLQKLAGLLGVPRPAAAGYLHFLWWGVLEQAPDGDLAGWDAADVAAVMEWGDDPTALVAALREAGWLDGPAEGPWAVHDWGDWASDFVTHAGKRRDASRRANHERWHVQRGVADPTCAYCPPSQPSPSLPDDDSTPLGLRTDSDLHPNGVRTESLEEKRGEEKRGEGEQEKGKAASATPARPRPPSPSPEARALAAELKTALQSRGVTAFARDWHLTAASAAQSVLASGLTPEDARALMIWVLAHPFWGPKVGHWSDVRHRLAEWQQRHLAASARDSPESRLTLDARNAQVFRDREARAAEGGTP